MKYEIDRDEIELSVDELCDMASSRGSIDCRRSAIGLRGKSADF